MKRKKQTTRKDGCLFLNFFLISCPLFHASMSYVEGTTHMSEVRLRWRRRTRRKKKQLV